MEALTLVAAAAAVTKLVDFVRGFDAEDSWPKVLWIALSMALGIIGAFMFNIAPPDLPATLRFEVSGVGLQVATGLVVGGLASGVHELFDFLSSAAKRS